MRLSHAKTVRRSSFPNTVNAGASTKLRTDHAEDRLFLSPGATNAVELMQALGSDEVLRSIWEQDITVVIPRQNDRSAIVLLEVE